MFTLTLRRPYELSFVSFSALLLYFVDAFRQVVSLTLEFSSYSPAFAEVVEWTLKEVMVVSVESVEEYESSELDEQSRWEEEELEDHV